MEKNKQMTLGSGNIQVMIENMNYNASDVYKSIGKVFKELDAQINQEFPEKIEYSKLKGTKRLYESSKIFASLIKIDIPFENAFHIVYLVGENILTEKREGKYEDGMSTHKIRKIVANTILNYDINEVPMEIIQKWGDKYVRRYGHDGQRVNIYFSNSEEQKELDYEFVKNTLMEDIISDLKIKEKTYKNEIMSSHISSISEEIIEFINNCNMYKIKYNTLKEFIIEMALQPPHPWFVTNKTAKRICKYDIEILEKHYIRLCEAKKNELYDDSYYTICEALHHGCSSILAKYNEVLGCNDLDSFYNLERIAKLLSNRKFEDLIIENYAINNLLCDLKYIGIEINDFCRLLSEIKKKLIIGKNAFFIDIEFLNNVIELSRIAINLYKNPDKEDVEKFLYTEWCDYSWKQKNCLIKKIFEVINGISVSKFITSIPDCFWINREKYNREKDILVICFHEEINCQKITKFINSKKAIKNTEAIFLIVENTEDSNYKNILHELDESEHCIEIVSKDDLQKIFKSSNKYKEIIEILKRDLYR